MADIIDWPYGLPAQVAPAYSYNDTYVNGSYNPGSGYYDYSAAGVRQWGPATIVYPESLIVGDGHPGVKWNAEKGVFESEEAERFDNLAEGKCPICESACSLKRRVGIGEGSPYVFTHGKTTHLWTLAELRAKGWGPRRKPFAEVCKAVCPGKDASRDRKAFGGYFK